MKWYMVHSIFPTIQGEGVHAGTPAIFVRLSGCNVWSGLAKDRERASARGVCALWCDTEFRGTTYSGGSITLPDLLAQLLTYTLERPGLRLVVLTGGEPGLQVDRALVLGLQGAGYRVHVETNGSRELPQEIDWITLSPKPPMPVLVQKVDEVKCIYPDVDPEPWREMVPGGRVFIQPRDPFGAFEGAPDTHWSEAIAYVLSHPWCRLSVQTHKLLDIP